MRVAGRNRPARSAVAVVARMMSRRDALDGDRPPRRSPRVRPGPGESSLELWREIGIGLGIAAIGIGLAISVTHTDTAHAHPPPTHLSRSAN